MLDRLANRRHAPGDGGDETAERIDLGFEIGDQNRQAGLAHHIVDCSEAGDFPAGLAASRNQRRRLVMLVLDVADDLFDQVFEADHAARAAILVDHQSDVDPASLHADQQVGQRG